MVFSSTVFLFLFFPVVYILYLLVPSIHGKNGLLILVSLLFYAFGEPFAVFLMIGSVALSYLCGLGVHYVGKRKKLWTAIGVAGNLGLLCVYKYAGFFLGVLNDILPFSIPVPQLALPIGISFFVFQSISYVVDVAREETQVQRNPFYLLLYVAFFPQLIAGPIVKYHDIAHMITERKITASDSAVGMRRFICGMAKKLLIANTVGAAADAVFALDQDLLSMPAAWLGAICYTLQIYFDFSGYSDMAIGLGRMFGFVFKENFNYPYISESITEFWRRWHISVSTWFKEYLYFPLGGNRKGKRRTILNKWIVFLCTGFWHGANWTFLVWGALNGLFLMLEQMQWIPTKRMKWKPLRHFYTMLVVTLAFVIFRADSLSQAGQMYAAMFTGISVSGLSLSAFAQLLSPVLIVTLVAAIIGCMPVLPYVQNRLRNYRSMRIVQCTAYMATVPLLVLCIMNLSVSAYNPFIYFRF
jgi:alginate O-acetyltransferase complex protein AlgI